jgi:hypothetical protein
MSERWEEITGYNPNDRSKRRDRRQPHNPHHNTTFYLDTGEAGLINSVFDTVSGIDYLFVEANDGYTYLINETSNGLLQGKRIDTRSGETAES